MREPVQTRKESLEKRARVRELGISIGTLHPGRHNALTDVPGVRVGHTTLNYGENVRTGVTAILPRADIWENRVFAATHVLNGNGEMTGSTWIDEIGWVETPIMLTSTYNIGRVWNGVIEHILTKLDPSIGRGYWFLPIVSECLDLVLNDAEGRHVTEEHVSQAIAQAKGGPVEEGAVGAGTGMVSYEFKGGIGTSSRVLPSDQGGFVVGALVNANHGRREQLLIDGVPVGREIPDLLPEIRRPEQGSIVIVVGTDAPLMPHQLRRIARRATLGLARTGSISGHGSGDLIIAFSTANVIPKNNKTLTYPVTALHDERINSLFAATVETTEEAIINALTSPKTMTGRNGNVVHAIPLDRLRDIMKKYGRLS